MAIEILGLLMAGAGASYGWWQMQRRRFSRMGREALETSFDADTQVAFGVATHAMTSRGHTELTALHLVYGLLQDEGFTTAIRALDGDPDAIESKVLALLDERAADPTGAAQALEVINRTYWIARSTDRKIEIADLWARLFTTDAGSLVTLDGHALLFRLVHGMAAPAPDLPGRTDVAVVLRNDNITTFELVMTLLQDVFGLTAADAEARAVATHHEGRAIVGRYKLAVARDKVIAARARAREQGFPLWIGLEDI